MARPASPTRRAVVTGLGPVSGLGVGRNELWDGLMAGRSGAGPITLCDAGASPCKIAVEVKDFDLGRFVDRGEKMARFTPRPVQLGLAAAVLALHDAEIDVDAVEDDRFAILVGTSVGNFETTMGYKDDLVAGRPVPSHAAFHTFHHTTACLLSSTLNIRGPLQTQSSGCNSGVDALGQALRLIQSGSVDAALVVGTDCEMVEEILAGMNASGSLTTRFNDEPHRASRPFDRDRDGNVLGEGAAALVVESEAYARARRARIYARVAGYHNASAGYNRQYSHDRPELDLRPCVRALHGAIRGAGWEVGQVDLYSANGSSSVIYDRLESLAVREAFGDYTPELPVHSIKSMLGQHGAGTSALQAVTACLSIRRRGIPPTINHENRDPECAPLTVVTEPLEYAAQRVLVHSIGLGGFYYSAAAFEAPAIGAEDHEAAMTGRVRVRWSDAAHPRYRPKEEFQAPLEPWQPTEG